MDRLMEQMDKLTDTVIQNHTITIEELARIRETQAVHAQQLKEHMRRTEAAEAGLEVFERTLSVHKSELVGVKHYISIQRKVLGATWKLLTAVVIGVAIKWLTLS